MTERGQVNFPSGSGRSPLPFNILGTPVMEIGLWGISPLFEIRISQMSVYQMTASKKLARGGVVKVPGDGQAYPISVGYWFC